MGKRAHCALPVGRKQAHRIATKSGSVQNPFRRDGVEWLDWGQRHCEQVRKGMNPVKCWKGKTKKAKEIIMAPSGHTVQDCSESESPAFHLRGHARSGLRSHARRGDGSHPRPRQPLVVVTKEITVKKVYEQYIAQNNA